MKYAVVNDGQVVNVILWDGQDDAVLERFINQGSALHELDDESLVGPGWSYDGQDFVAPVPPPLPAATAEQVLAERDRLLRYAATRIAPLQDAVDLVDANAAETALLTEWKRYRIALGRIEQQSGFPAAVVWPDAPQ